MSSNPITRAGETPRAIAVSSMPKERLLEAQRRVAELEARHNQLSAERDAKLAEADKLNALLAEEVAGGASSQRRDEIRVKRERARNDATDSAAALELVRRKLDDARRAAHQAAIVEADAAYDHALRRHNEAVELAHSRLLALAMEFAPTVVEVHRAIAVAAAAYEAKRQLAGRDDLLYLRPFWEPPVGLSPTARAVAALGGCIEAAAPRIPAGASVKELQQLGLIDNLPNSPVR